MDWSGFIHSDPEIASGRPIVKGTRLTVEFLLELFANGWTREQVLESYPTLTIDAIKAVFAFAAETMNEDTIFIGQQKAA